MKEKYTIEIYILNWAKTNAELREPFHFFKLLTLKLIGAAVKRKTTKRSGKYQFAKQLTLSLSQWALAFGFTNAFKVVYGINSQPTTEKPRLYCLKLDVMDLPLSIYTSYLLRALINIE